MVPVARYACSVSRQGIWNRQNKKAKTAGEGQNINRCKAKGSIAASLRMGLGPASSLGGRGRDAVSAVRHAVLQVKWTATDAECGVLSKLWEPS
jgi:hypothetical protein